MPCIKDARETMARLDHHSWIALADGVVRIAVEDLAAA